MRLGIQFLCSVLLAAGAASCDRERDELEAHGRPVVVATIQPIAMLLREMVGPEIEVVCLVPPGSSPHTFEPSPSEMRAVERSTALFMVGPGLDDWAERLPAAKTLRCMDLVPPDLRLTFDENHSQDEGEHEHHAGGIDPHFWTDPAVGAAVTQALGNKLAELLPGRADYDARIQNFTERLFALELETQTNLAGARGRSVILFHPSFGYLLRRFGVRIAGVIEPSPGKEPSPKQIKALRDIMLHEGITTVFTEPQLNPGPARALAEAAGAKLAELDPNGGTPGRETYEELIRYNSRVLAEALQ